jgi:hypothetical protein
MIFWKVYFDFTPGARGTQNYTNIIVFNQTDLTSVLSGITPIKLK